MRLFIKFFISIQLSFSFFEPVKGQASLPDSIFHPASFRHIIEVLSSDSLNGRFAGTAENHKAALFIADEFKKAGLGHVVGTDGFFQPVKPGWFNVIGAIKGKSKPGQVIIFSAHYDHVGTDSTNPFPHDKFVADNDQIYNGANDNATGVAAVICLAKYFKALNNNERTLLFIAFTGEELGLLGSQFLADEFETDSIVAVINIEMIGRSEFKNPRPYITGYEYSNLKKILNRNYQAFGDSSEKEFFKGDPYFKSLLFIRSDNYPFALKGVPAHSIMLTSPTDKYYHHPDDEAWTLDYLKMKKIITGIAFGTIGLVKGIDTPARIKKIY
ncbi:MAG TPA: M20/M25/M40 family metallo-hydrolase [Chitinophagaceae bacterium]|nr:M20/M25/M40 family metallo-hydrolase [Chitinophagaceae bacterium]